MNFKILVIEDNKDIQSLLFDVLSKRFLVYQATDGISGIKLFKKFSPDLIILDLMLPQINGSSVLKIIRNQSNVPIIILTAIQSKGKTVEVLDKGANDYLTKPFDIDELIARIDVQLRNNPDIKTEDIIKFDNITINDVLHKAVVNSNKLNLSKKEYELLKILLLNPHQVFEKGQLFQMIWHEEYFDSSENTLNVHISNLRRKLLKASGKKYIISIWSIGIRFV